MDESSDPGEQTYREEVGHDGKTTMISDMGIQFHKEIKNHRSYFFATVDQKSCMCACSDISFVF